MKIKLTEGNVITEGGISTYVTVLSAEEILGSYNIDYRKAGRKHSYQRLPSKQRLNQIANKVLKYGVAFPNSILLNIRSEDAKNSIKNGILDYEPSVHGPLWIVDGQNRILGIKTAIEIEESRENPNLDLIKKLKETKLHISLMISENVAWEVFLFLEVNKEAKKVPTNLAEQVMFSLAKSYSSIRSMGYDDKGQKWKLLANQLTEMMNDDHDNPWHKKIAGGNEKISGPSVSYSGFSKSLKELLETPVFAQGDTESNFQRLKAYWNGIEEVNPDMFQGSLYSIQSQIGVTVFHNLYGVIRELVLRNPQDQQNLSESQTFVPVIRYLFENNTEGSDANGEQLNGKEFWLKGKAGAVGSYSSLAGYKRLKTEFIDILKNYSYPR